MSKTRIRASLVPFVVSLSITACFGRTLATSPSTGEDAGSASDEDAGGTTVDASGARSVDASSTETSDSGRIAHPDAAPREDAGRRDASEPDASDAIDANDANDAGDANDANDASDAGDADDASDANDARDAANFDASDASRYGNTDVACSADNSFGAGYLLGEQITIPRDITLVALAAVTYPGGGFDGTLALYTNAAAIAPGALVASTPSTLLLAGANEIPVTPVAVAAGTYWMMGIYPAGGTMCTSGVLDQSVDYISLGAGASLPDPFPSSFTNYTGYSFGYYVVGY